MEKHKNIPEAATWNAADNQWELGQKDEQGREIGIWEMWHTEGYYCGTTDYGDGTPPFLFRRFHPDGTLAQEGNWYGGNKWLGTYRWIKSKNSTPEGFPSGYPRQGKNIWRVEFDYVEEGVYHAQRFYDIKDRPVNVHGISLPARPASVPEIAHFIDEGSSATGYACWVMGLANARLNAFIGEYLEWDLNGAPIVKRLYDRQTGSVIEEHSYINGRLWKSNVFTADSQTQSFYHEGIEPPVVSHSTLYHNNRKDHQKTYFDTSGKELFVFRSEEISDLHQRKYYNGVLVYEGIQSKDKEKTPSSFIYYYPEGTTLINYTSNGDGTGQWRMYDKDGHETLSLPEVKETDRDERNKWDVFTPYWDDDEPEKMLNYWDAVIGKFKNKHLNIIVAAKIENLEVPPHLASELAKVDWKNTDSAMTGGETLPPAINGMLAEDSAIATKCESRIWYEIEHQGTIYEATYKVATVLARMMPYYTHSEIIQRRLFQFLFEVFGLAYISESKKLYKELINAVQPSLPTIMQNANDADDGVALASQYLLLEAGRNTPETEAFFIREWQRTDNTTLRRAYAAFALGDLYIQTKQHPKGITVFTEAFAAETNTLVRLVLAIQLVTAAKKEADAIWLAELIGALTDPEAVDENFYKLQPFIGDFDVQEYLLMVLGYANPDVLQKNIEPIIEIMPSVGMLKQETLLRAVFSVLFQKRSALKSITPIRKKALLAAAEVADQHKNLLNHKEIFESFNLPHDSYKLRKLADGPMAL
ncbi:hypothetical protein [Chitinophaga ginsengisoli]|nr:hypothetical protein [Chitinophaga ginsengisoli]